MQSRTACIDTTIMNGFSPEFAQLWVADRASPGESGRADRAEEMTPSLQEALDELAERVSAARSVY